MALHRDHCVGEQISYNTYPKNISMKTYNYEVVGLGGLIEQQQIVIVGNRLG